MASIEKSSDQNEPSRDHRRSNSYNQAMSSAHPEVNILPVKTIPSQPEKKLPETQSKVNDDIHMIKWIEFNCEQLPILLQNVNGPCPLLAIANILLLRKRIRLNSNTTTISTERVIAVIVEYMLQIDPTKLQNDGQANYERNIEDALTVLPKLKTGIDINLKFNGVDKFEYTRECIIFDLLGIQLFHGWVIDPQNDQLQKIVHSDASSYNQLVEKMIGQKQCTNEERLRESLLIEQFLEENRSQLTHYGILQLNETMRDNQLAVLFRNNHFSVLWKNKKQLLLLVSDQGYLNHRSIVFETLTDIDNNSSFTDGYGQVWQRPVPVDTTRDRDLAIAVHNAEQRQYHDEQSQQQQQQRYAQGYYREQGPRRSKKKHQRPSDEDDYHNNCILS